MAMETLYNHGYVIGKIAEDGDYQSCKTHIISSIKALDGVFDMIDTPRMGSGIESPDEIPFSVFVEQGSDLKSLSHAFSQVAGVIYVDLDSELVRAPKVAPAADCGQVGHVCSCGKGPK